MKAYYDLHIHTGASPCGDPLMSPNNIVNMAKLKGLDVIGITDHQTCCNCKVIQQVGTANGLVVIPGIEIECEEEFHLIALFPSCEVASKIEHYVKMAMPSLPNDPRLFGGQQCFNEADEVIAEMNELLLVASQRTAYDIVKEVRRVGGVIYPAHIDRKSYSIISQLGILPETPHFTTLEVSKTADIAYYQKQYPTYKILQSSDAHYLEDISEADHFLNLSKLSVEGLLSKLRD